MRIGSKIFILLSILLRTNMKATGSQIANESKKSEGASFIYIIKELISLKFIKNENIEEDLQNIEYNIDNIDNTERVRCISTLLEMITSPTSPAFTNFLTYSGKGAHDLGDFPACRGTGTSRYILGNAIMVLSVGLCVPKECSATDFTAFLYYIADYMRFPPPVGFVFVDPQLNNDTMGTIGGGAITIISIFVILILLVLLAALYDIYILQIREAECKLHHMDIPQKTRFEEIVVFFSLANNAKSLIYSKNRIDPNLDVFHGVRFLSISWVIFGHSFVTFIAMPVNNINSLFSSAHEDFGFSLITAGTLSVDTFFMLSGFFSILGVWKEVGKPGGKAINILKCYLHRYIRLLPLYTIIILISIYIMPLFVFGPANFFIDDIARTCKEKWWWNLLYINNAQSMATECLVWTWYLANDMQMFLLAPILVYIYCMRPMWGIMSVGLLATLSSILQIVFIVKDNWMASMLSLQAAPGAYYQRPWMRINTYLVGIIGAWIYLSYKEDPGASGYLHPAAFRNIAFKIRNSAPVRYIYYILGFTLTFLAVFLMFPFVHLPITNRAANALFLWLYRPAFVIGLIMVLFPVLVGHGRPLLVFLGAPFFAPLGRMTYGVYMIHLEIFYYLIGIQEAAQYYTFHMVFFWTARIIFISYFVSMFLTLVLEAPIMRMEQWVLRGQFIRKKKEGVGYTAIIQYKP